MSISMPLAGRGSLGGRRKCEKEDLSLQHGQALLRKAEGKYREAMEKEVCPSNRNPSAVCEQDLNLKAIVGKWEISIHLILTSFT